jgi:hypothetical protein
MVAAALSLGSHAASAQQRVVVSDCVNALEQVEALEVVAPAYRMVGVDSRKYLDDADRPAEIARLRKAVSTACSKPGSKSRKDEEAEATRLHMARSPECALERDKLAMMEQPNSREARASIEAQRRLVSAQCPEAPTENVWLLQIVWQ